MYVKVNTHWNCAVFNEKNATQRAKHVAEQNIALSVYSAITVFVIVARPESVPSQIVKARTTSSYMELKKFFLLRILKTLRRQVTQTLNMYRLTLPSEIFIARSQVKASYEFHHSPSLRTRR